jgi:hypothetical protein
MRTTRDNVTRSWFEFDFTGIKNVPPGMSLGCGITAHDYNDAIMRVQNMPTTLMVLCDRSGKRFQKSMNSILQSKVLDRFPFNTSTPFNHGRLIS